VRVDLLPGSQWRYSGGGYEVVQQLILDVSGKSFAELARAFVFQPLGMTHSTFEQPLPEARRANAASGHRSDGAPLPGRAHTYPELAAAGLWTTPSDLCKIIVELQSSGGRVLKPETQRQMLTKSLGNYGLGLGVEEKVFSHGGANEGFRCSMVGYKSGGRGIVVMTNGDRGGQLASEIQKNIAADRGW